jgi:MFS-type transporter involved in bile tolerance (Atg22 family)
LFPSLLFLFNAGGSRQFSFARSQLLQIHTDETNRGRIMSLFGLINRGLGPMGSFPFGLIATAMTPSMTPSMTPFMIPFMTHV